MSSLSQMVESSKQGISLDDLKHLLGKLHIDSASLALHLGELWDVPCPAILHWDQSHFVVLFHVDRKKKLFYIADPDEGVVKLGEREFLEHWAPLGQKGIVLVVNPTPEFFTIADTSEKQGIRFLRYLGKVISSKKKNFITIAVCSLLCMGADLVLPLLTQATVDDGIQHRNINIVLTITLFQALVLIGNLISQNFVQYINSKLGLLLSKELTIKYFSKLLSLPLIFFDKKSSADLIQKLADQLRIKNFVVQLPTSVFLLTLNVIVFSGLLLYYNPMLFLIFIGFIALQIAWNALFLKKRKDFDYIYYRTSSKIQNLTYESINGIQDIKIANAIRQSIHTWEKYQEKYMRLGIKSTVLEMGMSSVSSFIEGIKNITLTAICAILVINNHLTLGEMLAVGYVIGRLSTPLSGLLGLINQTQDANTSFERLSEVLDTDTSAKPLLSHNDESIVFDDVSFKYAGNASPYVIKNLSLSISKGELVAVVGESGCGKTTLLKLMMGLYPPQNGQILLGGRDVAELNQDEWIARCGVVMQNGYIFSDTLLYNITFSNDTKDLSLVDRVLDIVGLREFVNTLPSKLVTTIGASGIELSGGQKQRILIARALYRNPEILIMDEPTSSLDASNEARITNNIFEFQKGKTTIIAAHRLSTIRNADTILFMKDGQIVEVGRHDELIRQRGHYYDLVKSQL